jgi:adenine-specific DNA-methyltransferase
MRQTVTELNFKGKEFVYNHHLAVPFRPLVPDESKGIGPVALDGNLIVHGDNLHALKALLPLYAGKVDCIFIDPPYNTGNEGWAYNDNVNAPMIREWLESNPIGIEDGLRHDKWCAMMWPRLRLLHELLAENGSLWITLDDNELANILTMTREIFGEGNFISVFVWQKRKTRENRKVVSTSHDYIICLAKNREIFEVTRNMLPLTDVARGRYKNPDSDPRGEWQSVAITAQAGHGTKSQFYDITTPSGRTIKLSSGSCWRFTETRLEELIADGRIWFGEEKNNVPRQKVFLAEQEAGLTPHTLWLADEVGTTDSAKRALVSLFGGESIFETPKPIELLERIIHVASDKDSIILDSFAGSGTTAHAVLEANKRDGGNRHFILVEMEDYADKLTAERVRRVINGYAFTGTQRTELLRDNITWTKLKNADKLTEAVEAIETLHGHEYDAIKKTVKDGELIVTGEKAVKDKTEGLGGSFTYCTLGDPVELDKILSGETLPSFDGLGSVLFHMATAHAFDPAAIREDDFYLGTVEGQHLWLIYKPDLDWLKSPEAALTLKRAKDFAATDTDVRHLVFAPARYVSQKMLAEQNIPVEFVPLPFALYRIDRS